MSLTPALRRPWVDGVRVEVNRQVRGWGPAGGEEQRSGVAGQGAAQPAATTPSTHRCRSHHLSRRQVLSRGGNATADALEDTGAASQLGRGSAGAFLPSAFLTGMGLPAGATLDAEVRACGGGPSSPAGWEDRAARRCALAHH